MDKKSNNINKWNSWPWNPLSKQFPNVPTMKKGAEFLKDCKTVEDWGCGDGIFKHYREDAIGVDGSNTPGADKKFVDLSEYITDCEGIFMHHVLEHNYNWDQILHNMLKSARKKICIVFFIPFTSENTIEIPHHPIDVPNLSISEKKFLGILSEYGVNYEIEQFSKNDKLVYITKIIES